MERDLSAHLETALRGVVIGERWPKSGVDVIITVLEGEEDRWWGDEINGGVGGAGSMSVLAGAITASSAALVDAGIDCVDLVAGGVAAVVGGGTGTRTTVQDPAPAEHQDLTAVCMVGYLAERDEITELWVKGDAGEHAESLLEKAVEAATASRTVLVDAVMEAAKRQPPIKGKEKAAKSGDVEMMG
jgi:exosome complex component MTR3